MNILHHHAVLGPDRRERIVALLTSRDTPWESSERLGRAGQASVSQLAHGPNYATPDLMLLRRVMASVCYANLRDHFALPKPSELTPQVFPVSMRGDKDQPPSQRTHIDRHGTATPLVTGVYYARVRKTVGGDIVLDPDARHLVLHPDEDDLIAFPGDTLHAVNALYAGDRLSIVCNFYSHPDHA